MLAHPLAKRAKPKPTAAWKFQNLDMIRHQILQRAGRFSCIFLNCFATIQTPGFGLLAVGADFSKLRY